MVDLLPLVLLLLHRRARLCLHACAASPSILMDQMPSCAIRYVSVFDIFLRSRYQTPPKLFFFLSQDTMPTDIPRPEELTEYVVSLDDA